MRNATSVSIKLLVALGAMGTVGMASASSTASQAASVINNPNNQGLTAGLLTVTGANTAATIGGTVGAIAGGAASGGGAFSALPAGVTRIALPGQGGKGAAAAPGGKAFNAWFAVSENNISYDYAPLQSSGKVRVGLLGIDYTFGNNVVAGLAIARDKTNVDLNGATFAPGSKLKGSGTTYSPYVGMPLNKNWAADISLGWGKTKVNTDDNTGASSQFDDKRQTASIGLSYRQLMAGNKWMLTGRGSYLDIKDELPGATITLRQLRFGGQAAYNAGIFSPYAGLNYIYDVKAPETQGAANDRDSFQAVLGIRFSAPNSIYGGLQYSSELNRSQVKNNQIMLNLGARF